ncbi:MAG: glycosyltransferase family 2 protein [Bacteroidetes bacterium]|nr:glycosyltransferase family 2 protein [Bacteroidota bacterium]
MDRITAIIITRNEEANIERCISSLQDVVDETLVLDSQSSDKTVEICERLGAKVIDQQWLGYAKTKNLGNEMASSDWILSIDADEELSDMLKNSVTSVKQSLEGSYSFNRLTNYAGKWIHHCGWYPDTKIRLFNRKNTFWEDRKVHETIGFKTVEKITHLDGDLLHYSFKSVADHLERARTYSDLASQEIVKNKRTFLFLKMFFSPPTKFVKSYFFHTGFLDGYFGFLICLIGSFEVYLKYAKALRLRWSTPKATN